MMTFKGLCFSALELAIIVSGCLKSEEEEDRPQLFAGGFSRPVCIANAGDSRLFVADQHGIINILDSAGNIYPEPFLDITDRVVYGGERGLLGIAFHPGYLSNGYLYVNYIGAGDSTHVSRFSVSPGNRNKADSLSEMKLLTIWQPFNNHNGGDLCFGPDGFLYTALGDGGSEGDPDNRSQNPRDFHGKMLRIDVDHGDPYTIPATNPFYGNSNIFNEIWALGLRNPWRFSFDRLTGDLWIADVGQDKWEEIDFHSSSGTGGENYGWSCFEGDQPYKTGDCKSTAEFTFPVYTYQHGPECSVTGGYVYRGLTSSPYYGYYFFADFCTDQIWTLHYESGKWIRKDFASLPGNSFSTFGEDYRGGIYVAGLASGNIYRLIQ